MNTDLTPVVAALAQLDDGELAALIDATNVSDLLMSSGDRHWAEPGWRPPTMEVDTNAGREAEAVE